MACKGRNEETLANFSCQGAPEGTLLPIRCPAWSARRKEQMCLTWLSSEEAWDELRMTREEGIGTLCVYPRVRCREAWYWRSTVIATAATYPDIKGELIPEIIRSNEPGYRLLE